MKFLIENFIEIIANSHALVRNNTEIACVPFTQFPPKTTFLKL